MLDFFSLYLLFFEGDYLILNNYYKFSIINVLINTDFNPWKLFS